MTMETSTPEAEQADLTMLAQIEALMLALRQEAQPLSAQKLCKRLNVRMSTLLRCLAYLGEQDIAGQAGLGWVHSEQQGERLLLSLTATGLAACASW
ncbi:MAG: hypothetical protein ACOYNW_03370 [Undibacterium curvum]|uniref:hypothetical protein n=1 Tax=Undibacterium curvum TaxID=2762294 RepID=UPI003BD90150